MSADLRSHSVSHYLCPTDMRLSDFLDLVVSHGFGGVGLTQRALDELPARHLRRELDARNLFVTALNSAGYFLAANPADIARQAALNSSLLHAANEIGGASLNIITGGPAHFNLRDARARIAEALAIFALSAERYGVPLLVEPLHPSVAATQSCLNTIAHAEKLIADLPSISINLDFYHLWWDPDFDRFAEEKNRRLGLIQVCDIGAPVGGLARRVPQDEGALDWRDLLARLQASSSAVPIELELFADQLPGRSTQQILASAASAFSSTRGGSQ